MNVGDRVWRYGPGGPIGTVTRVDYISANVHWDDQAPGEDDDLLQKDRLQVVTESEWARRVGEIETEVERLRFEHETIMVDRNLALEEVRRVDAKWEHRHAEALRHMHHANGLVKEYRAAVAEIMVLVTSMGMADEDEQCFWSILNKLPKDEP